MGLDYSEFKRMRDNFAKLTREFDSWLHRFLLNEGMRFIAEVKPRTPVDTGDLRNHWKLDGITRSGDTLQVWFVNPMYYATFVEYGHAKPYKSGATEGSPDWVEGYFMMTVSLEIIQRNMPARFNQQFNAFITSLGVK
jgi:hypothetical protein